MLILFFLFQIEDNEKYSVQFLDFGNIETCSHEDLRSTLYMTDIPQLCFKGYFASIIPVCKQCSILFSFRFYNPTYLFETFYWQMTDNKKWSTKTLDYLHSLIVEHMCTVTIDLSLSHSSSYAVSTAFCMII